MVKAAVLQIDSIPDDQWANIKKIDAMIAGLGDPEVRLAAFCEYGLSGFSNNLRAISEPVPGLVTEALEKVSRERNIWLTGGIPEKIGDDGYANSMVLISPQKGLVANYRKVHPFSSERNKVVYGAKPVVVDTEIGKIGLSICYDFVFPEFIRGLRLMGAEVIINSTFWYADNFSTPLGWGPEHALAMSRVRALENKCYVVMACRTGVDVVGNNTMHGFGHSSIADPMGCLVARAALGETVIKAEIDLNYLEKCNEIGYMNDRRPEIYRDMLDLC